MCICIPLYSKTIFCPVKTSIYFLLVFLKIFCYSPCHLQLIVNQGVNLDPFHIFSKLTANDLSTINSPLFSLSESSPLSYIKYPSCMSFFLGSILFPHLQLFNHLQIPNCHNNVVVVTLGICYGKFLTLSFFFRSTLAILGHFFFY